MAAPRCSFCGLIASGGVAGPSPELYICKECIRHNHELLEGSRSPGSENRPDAS